MNKKLNNVIEKSLIFSNPFKDKDIVKDEETKNIFEAARDQTAKEIYNEIKNEIKSKAIEEAQEEIKNQTLLHKIKELKKLTIIGIMIAFFTGMGVNQATGLFSLMDFFKKWYGMVIILLGSIIIVMVIIFCWIFKEEKNERNIYK